MGIKPAPWCRISALCSITHEQNSPVTGNGGTYALGKLGVGCRFESCCLHQQVHGHKPSKDLSPVCRSFLPTRVNSIGCEDSVEAWRRWQFTPLSHRPISTSNLLDLENIGKGVADPAREQTIGESAQLASKHKFPAQVSWIAERRQSPSRFRANVHSSVVSVGWSGSPSIALPLLRSRMTSRLW